MKPDDIATMTVPGRPAIAPDGSVLVALSRPDIEAGRYSGRLSLFAPPRAEESSSRNEPSFFTGGPRDSAPGISPNGHTVIFLRAAETGPAQLHSIELHGGEARKLTSHLLGVTPWVFSLEGSQIAYLAPVPADGRYGSDPDLEADAEPPRPIGRMSYRLDGKGFTIDRPD